MNTELKNSILNFKSNFNAEREELITKLFQYTDQSIIPYVDKLRILFDSDMLKIDENASDKSIFMLKYKDEFMKELITKYPKLNKSNLNIYDSHYNEFNNEKGYLFRFNTYIDITVDYKDLIPVLKCESLKDTFKISKEELFATIYEYIKTYRVIAFRFDW